MKTALTRPRPRHRRKSEPRSERPRVLTAIAPEAVLALKKILVPTDFSPASLKALQDALPFAERSGAAIVLLHVIEPASFVNGFDSISLTLTDETQVQRAKSELIFLAQKEIKPLIPVNPQVRLGKPAEEIVATAKNVQADLIVIATHGYTGLKRAFIGSTAERVVRCAPCPVLVVRENEHDFISPHANPEN